MFSLPPIKKKVIYLDQFVISEMMKILNPNTKAFQKGTVDKYWLNLFKKLDTLCKLQLIVCPDSFFHRHESLLSPFYDPLKRMYELLSGGITFFDYNDIRRIQLFEHASNWISGRVNNCMCFDVQSIANGKINVWEDKFIISLNTEYPPDWIDDIRRDRKTISREMGNVFKRWQSEKDKSFNEWFKEEVFSFGKIILSKYLSYHQRLQEHPEERPIFAFQMAMRPEEVKIIECIITAFKKANVPDYDIPQKTIEYLTFDNIKKVPYIKISSMLYAAIARKAASGSADPPNEGMDYDIKMLSAFLPYCDAIFIDKICHAYLCEVPLRDEINYGTHFFSLNNKEEFISYLDEIEKNTPSEHFEKVKEVYGENWEEPYTNLFM